MRKIKTMFGKNSVGFLIIGKKRIDKIEVSGLIGNVTVKHSVGMAKRIKPDHADPDSSDLLAESVSKIGDLYPVLLKNGETVDFVVTEITSDYIRFDSRDCIGGIKTRWNESGSNAGGYPGSTLWNVVNGEILNLFPEKLLDRMMQTERYYMNGDSRESYESKLFVPVAPELFDSDECLGDEGLYEQMEYYKDRRHRMKGSKKGEDTAPWWLASVYSGASNYACFVSSYGSPGYHHVYSPYCGVPVCFRIKR